MIKYKIYIIPQTIKNVFEPLNYQEALGFVFYDFLSTRYIIREGEVVDCNNLNKFVAPLPFRRLRGDRQ